MTEKTVKVYILNCEKLADGGLFDRYYNLMPKQRREKIDRARFDGDKRLLLGAGILLEKALGEYGTENISALEHGKPYIPDCPLHFSVSHSGNIAMLALADCEVGCDVQEIKTFSLKTAQRFFSADEYKMLKETDGVEQTRLFFRLWALKESYIKATGRGLSQPLDEFTVSFTNGKPFVKQNRQCALAEIEITPGYSAAACVFNTQNISIKTVRVAV